MSELTIKAPEEMTAEELGGEIRFLTRQFKGLILSAGIQIGYRLTIAHEKVGPHGWAEWLKRETEFSRAGASRFEKVYKGYGSAQGSLLGVENNFPTLENISVSNALSLLAIPAEEREEVAAELDAAHISNRELEKRLAEREAEIEAARRRLEETEADRDGLREALSARTDFAAKAKAEAASAAAAAQEAEKQLAAERERREDAEKTIAEMNARPVEVITQRDEEAITAAAEAAKKEAEAEAEKKLAAAMEKADRTAGELRKQLAEARSGSEDVEALKKKLEAAESGVGVANVYVKSAQQSWAEALKLIAAMHGEHPETAEKLARGMEMLADTLKSGAAKLREAW